jgi:RNA polymerase sigma factor (sigma-70 family)
VDERDRLAEPFEANRAHLRAVAYRMLGSQTEADDAIQETWLRLHRSDTSGVANMRAWLTTVVGRVSLDMLRSRKARSEEPLDAGAPDPVPQAVAPDSPETATALADSVGVALLVLLETLEPAERVAFVLHDLFAMSFDDIAPIVGRSPGAARQLASRARRRVQGTPAATESDRAAARTVVDAFLAASREGNFAALLAVLDPNVVLHADAAAVELAKSRGRGAPKIDREVKGADAIATAFSGAARAARPALIDGMPGAVWLVHDKPRSAFVFRVAGGKIVDIDLVMESDHLAELDIAVGG